MSKTNDKNNEKALIAQAIKQSQKLSFNEKYSNIVDNLRPETDSDGSYMSEEDGKGILDYDFLKPSTKKNASSKAQKKVSPTVTKVKQTVGNSIITTKFNNKPEKITTFYTKVEQVAEGSTTKKIREEYKQLQQEAIKEAERKVAKPPAKPANTKFNPSILKPAKKEVDNAHLTLYTRILEQERKKENFLAHVREQKNLEENKALLEKPQISQNSKKIIKDKFQKIEPLHTRIGEVLIDKSYKLDKIRRQIRSASEEASLLYTYRSPTNNNFTSTKNHPTDVNITGFGNQTQLATYDNPRTNSCSTKTGFENWYKQNEKWAIEKDQNQKHSKRVQAIEQMNSYTFHPQISEKSKMLISNKNNEEFTQESFYDRLMQKQVDKENNLETLRNEFMPSFQPSITNKIPDYVREKQVYLDGPKGAKKKYVSPHSKKLKNKQLNKSMEMVEVKPAVQKTNVTPIMKNKKKRWEDIIDTINYKPKNTDRNLTFQRNDSRHGTRSSERHGTFKRDGSRHGTFKRDEERKMTERGDSRKVTHKEAKSLFQGDMGSNSIREDMNEQAINVIVA